MHISSMLPVIVHYSVYFDTDHISVEILVTSFVTNGIFDRSLVSTIRL